MKLLVFSGDHTGAMVAGDNRLSPTVAAAETAPTGYAEIHKKLIHSKAVPYPILSLAFRYAL